MDFEPALEETAQVVRPLLDRLIGGENDVGMEMLRYVAEPQNDTPVAVIGIVERNREIDDGGVDRLGFQRGDPCTVLADGHRRHTVVAPALLP